MENKIFQPISLHGLTLANRLVRSATWEGVATEQGGIMEEAYPIYEELAKGGSGMIITGFTSVADNDHYFEAMMRLSRDELIPQYKRLVDIIHREGVPVIPQLALGAYYDGYRQIEPTEMTVEEIHSVIGKFNEAAVRAEKAGFDGVLFDNTHNADAVVIAITGIHGNFYSNPFYYNFGDTFNSGNIDFVYAQTNDAFGRIQTVNVKTGKTELIGSWNERFELADEDVKAYVDWAVERGYRHIFLAGHSLGANKVIHYLSATNDQRVERFILLSPANLEYLTGGVTEREKSVIRRMVQSGHGQEMLPFPFMGWVECTADTAYSWLYSGMLDNVHVEPDKDFSQIARITIPGALLIGTYDNFTYGDPSGFLRNINNHFPNPDLNDIIFIPNTGHTYQQKEQETADVLLRLVTGWLNNDLKKCS